MSIHSLSYQREAGRNSLIFTLALVSTFSLKTSPIEKKLLLPKGTPFRIVYTFKANNNFLALRIVIAPRLNCLVSTEGTIFFPLSSEQKTEHRSFPLLQLVSSQRFNIYFLRLAARCWRICLRIGAVSNNCFSSSVSG